MNTFDNLLLGFQVLSSLDVILACLGGVVLGTFLGVLPGIGAMAAMSLLMPITYYLEPTSALVMLAGVYYGTMFGGATTSILLNLPGTPVAAVTCLDGYPLTKKGKAGVALFTAMGSSFFGSIFGLIVLIFLTPYFAKWGNHFGPTEYAAMIFLGLVSTATTGLGSSSKNVSMILLGLLLSFIGTDISTGLNRFTFNLVGLSDGLSIVVVAMGLFGISEIIFSTVSEKSTTPIKKITFKELIPEKKDVRAALPAAIRGSALGSLLGALPGTGAGIAAFMAYANEKSISKEPEKFGHGAIEGVAGPESANNAAAMTAFVPTLSLGIPGEAMMALVLGAMIIHGIQPGPLLITNHPDVFWGLISSFILGSFLLFIINVPLIGIWVNFLRIPFHYLAPAIVVFICLGIYSINNSIFDILVAAVIGSLGTLLIYLRFNPAPLLLGFVLGPLFEQNLKRALSISRGDVSIFIERPISLFFLSIAALFIVYSVLKMIRKSATAT